MTQHAMSQIVDAPASWLSGFGLGAALGFTQNLVSHVLMG
jgi:hypothetical protein